MKNNFKRCKSQNTTKHLARAFNEKVQPRLFQVGDQVLALRRPIITTHDKTGGKFTSKWEGPYVVDGEGFQLGPMNGKFLKRYFPQKTIA